MTIRAYRKKPLEVNAVQWTGDNFSEVQDLATNSACHAMLNGDELVINTLEGTLSDPVPIGHWIIQGVQGEIYPCSPSVFDATYDPV